MSIFADAARDTGEILSAYSKAILPMVQIVVLALSIFIALSEFIPRDLSSTALWYDQLPIQDQSRQTPFAPFQNGPWSDMPTSTDIGGWFAVFVSLVQVAVGYSYATAGKFGLVDLGNGKKRPISSLVDFVVSIFLSRKITDVNQGKITNLLAWFGAIGIDTYTDIAYRSFDFTSGDSIMSAMFMSIVVLNLGSEYYIVHGPVRIYGLFQVSRIETQRVKQARSKAASSGGQHQKQQQRQKQRQQQKGQNNQGQQQGRGNKNRQQQNRQGGNRGRNSGFFSAGRNQKRDNVTIFEPEDLSPEEIAVLMKELGDEM